MTCNGMLDTKNGKPKGKTTYDVHLPGHLSHQLCSLLCLLDHLRLLGNFHQMYILVLLSQGFQFCRASGIAGRGEDDCAGALGELKDEFVAYPLFCSLVEVKRQVWRRSRKSSAAAKGRIIKGQKLGRWRMRQSRILPESSPSRNIPSYQTYLANSSHRQSELNLMGETFQAHLDPAYKHIDSHHASSPGS